MKKTHHTESKFNWKNKKWKTRILKITQTQLKQKSKDSIFSYKFQVGN